MSLSRRATGPRAALLALLALAGLAGCSSDGEGQRLSLGLLRDVLPFAAAPARPADPAYRALARAGAPELTLQRGTHPPETLRLAGTGPDGARDWLAPRGARYRLRDGLLVRATGIGQDLLGSDPGPLLPALRAGGRAAPVTRFQSHLDADGTVRLNSHVCQVTPVSDMPAPALPGTGPLLAEACRGAVRDFTNYYRMAPGGVTILHSLQWPDGGAGPGALRFTRAGAS